MFYRRMPRIPWAKHASNGVLEIMKTKRKLILNRKTQLKLPEFTMRKEGFENLILSGWIEGQGKATRDILNGLSKWMAEQGLGEIITIY